MVRLQRRDKRVGGENTGLKSEIHCPFSVQRKVGLGDAGVLPRTSAVFLESGLQVLFRWSVQLSLWPGLDSHLGLCIKWVCWQQQFYTMWLEIRLLSSISVFLRTRPQLGGNNPRDTEGHDPEGHTRGDPRWPFRSMAL